MYTKVPRTLVWSHRKKTFAQWCANVVRLWHITEPTSSEPESLVLSWSAMISRVWRDRAEDAGSVLSRRSSTVLFAGSLILGEKLYRENFLKVTQAAPQAKPPDVMNRYRLIYLRYWNVISPTLKSGRCGFLITSDDTGWITIHIMCQRSLQFCAL